MPFTLKYTCSPTPQQKPKPYFHPNLTHIDEYNLKIQKYSPIPYKNQILAHTHRRNEENIEFHKTLDSQFISIELREALISILSKIRKKECFAMRLIEEKIMALLEERVINIHDYRYVMDLMLYEKWWTCESDAQFMSVYGTESINSEKAGSKKDEMIVRVGTKKIPLKTQKAYSGLLTKTEEDSKLLSQQLHTEKMDFKTVITDLHDWISEHLEVPLDDIESQKVSKYRTINQICVLWQGEPPRSLIEEIQKITNIWENNGSDRDNKQKVYPELFPPRAVVLSLLQNAGVRVQRLDKSVIQTKTAESKYEKKQELDRTQYGAWYLPLSLWEKHYKCQIIGRDRTEKFIEEEATRTFVHARLNEFVSRTVNEVKKG